MVVAEARKAPPPDLAGGMPAPVPRRWRPSPLVAGSLGLHLAAALTLASALDRWPLAVAAVAADHTLLFGAGLWPRSRLLGPNVTRLPAGAARRGEVALTFDDGPDPRVTPAVFACLERHGVRASFFCIGRRAAAHPELVAEAVRRGHRVENHTWSHPHAFTCYLPAALRREVARAQEAIWRAGGSVPHYFRPPAGFRSPLLERELAAAGLHLAAWTRRGFDTVTADPERVLRRLLRRAAGGDVLLLHDGAAARDRQGTPVVLSVLPRLLDGLAARGLRATPLPPPPGHAAEVADPADAAEAEDTADAAGAAS